MNYFRKRAVQAVREKGLSAEVVSEVFGFSRSCIYTWLTRYDWGGYEALESRQAPGAEAVITAEMDAWLEATVVKSTPVAHGYDTVLWTRDILAELLQREFGVWVSGVTVSLHLRNLGLSYQQPCYRDVARDPHEVEYFLTDKFPRIQRLAENMGADIGFEDEAGVGVRTRAGRTWGRVGQPPEIPVAMQRGGYNLLSSVTAQGEMHYAMTDQNVNSERYIQFLRQLIEARERPLILVVDRVSFHGSKEVREFVRAHRTELRVFFLPKSCPEMNPDEQVWNEIKDKKIGRQPVKNKTDLRERLASALNTLQRKTERIRSFFELPDTKYASVYVH
jgi:transposase